MKIPPLFKKKSFYIPAVIAVIVAGAFFAFRGGNGEFFETQVVEFSSITSTVSETGSIRAGEEISLSFGRSGRVSSVSAREGDSVRRGQVLALLDNGSLSADLRQARVNLDLELASIGRSDIDFGNAESSLWNAIADAYMKADDAVRTKAGQLFTNPIVGNPTYGITINVGGTEYVIRGTPEETSRIDSLRAVIESDLNSLEAKIFYGAGGSAEEIAKAMEKTLQDAQQMLSFIAGSLNNHISPNDSSYNAYEGFRNTIAGARSSTGGALTSLRGVLQAYYSSRASVESSSGANSQTVALRNLRIENAQAIIDGIESRIAEGRIVSPIDGVVTGVSIRVGEIAGGSSPSVSIISEDDLEIIVDVPEDSIAFVDIGDKALIRFDAYRDLVLEAEVAFVSPRAHLMDGVSVFNVRLKFIEDDARVRAGLTVDIDIIAEERTGVISIPSRSVIERDGEQFVRVMVGEASYRRQNVVTGIRGDGMVEIMEGLSPGDRIITFASLPAIATLTEVDAYGTF